MRKEAIQYQALGQVPILVTDDHKTIRERAAKKIRLNLREALGEEIDTHVLIQSEAQRLASEKLVDYEKGIFLVDIHLGKEHKKAGIQFIEDIRKTVPQALIIVLTGYPDRREEAEEAGADFFFVKKYSEFEEIFHEISTHIAHFIDDLAVPKVAEHQTVATVLNFQTMPQEEVNDATQVYFARKVLKQDIQAERTDWIEGFDEEEDLEVWFAGDVSWELTLAEQKAHVPLTIEVHRHIWDGKWAGLIIQEGDGDVLHLPLETPEKIQAWQDVSAPKWPTKWRILTEIAIAQSIWDWYREERFALPILKALLLPLSDLGKMEIPKLCAQYGKDAREAPDQILDRLESLKELVEWQVLDVMRGTVEQEETEAEGVQVRLDSLIDEERRLDQFHQETLAENGIKYADSRFLLTAIQIRSGTYTYHIEPMD
ncbi:MAG: response regulator [Bacteroidota bacterium]